MTSRVKSKTAGEIDEGMEEAWKLTERQRKEGRRYVDDSGEGGEKEMEGGRFLREGQKDRETRERKETMQSSKVFFIYSTELWVVSP